jgi:hypothetical protein
MPHQSEINELEKLRKHTRNIIQFSNSLIGKIK